MRHIKLFEEYRSLYDPYDEEDWYGEISAINIGDLVELIDNKQCQFNTDMSFWKLEDIAESKIGSVGVVKRLEKLKHQEIEIILVKFEGEKLRWYNIKNFKRVTNYQYYL